MERMAIVAGIISTILFATSNIPMLVKAVRSRNLSSYSSANLLLANIGNLIHWVYIAALPWGPIWILHAFYTITSALMLIWYVRYRQTRASANLVSKKASVQPARRLLHTPNASSPSNGCLLCTILNGWLSRFCACCYQGTIAAGNGHIDRTDDVTHGGLLYRTAILTI